MYYFCYLNYQYLPKCIGIVIVFNLFFLIIRMGQNESGLLSPIKSRKSNSRLIIMTVNRNQFVFHYIIGEGGFGKVWKASHKNNKRVYAIKEMSKVKIINKKNEKGIMFEKEILARLNNK